MPSESAFILSQNTALYTAVSELLGAERSKGFTYWSDILSALAIETPRYLVIDLPQNREAVDGLNELLPTLDSQQTTLVFLSDTKLPRCWVQPDDLPDALVLSKAHLEERLRWIEIESEPNANASSAQHNHDFLNDFKSNSEWSTAINTRTLENKTNLTSESCDALNETDHLKTDTDSVLEDELRAKIAALEAQVEVQANKIHAFEEALLQSPLAVCHHDRELRYTWIYRPHMGFDSAAVIGKTDFDILDPDLAERMAVIKRRVLETGEGEQHIIPTFDPPTVDTEYFDLRTEARRNEAGEIIGLVCTGVDVTSMVRANTSLSRLKEKYERLSNTDTLTGLANRRALEEQCQRLDASREGARNEPTAVLMIDIDHFKTYNDTFGHQAGDAVLFRVARLLDQYARRGLELAARWGGEEFVLLLPGHNRAQVLAIAEAFRVDVLREQIKNPQSPQGLITVSVGISLRKAPYQRSLKELLTEADASLYTAKSIGRNCVR